MHCKRIPVVWGVGRGDGPLKTALPPNCLRPRPPKRTRGSLVATAGKAEWRLRCWWPWWRRQKTWWSESTTKAATDPSSEASRRPAWTASSSACATSRADFGTKPGNAHLFYNNSKTNISQDMQIRFPVQLAFAKFLSKIKGNFWGSAVSMILALY